MPLPWELDAPKSITLSPQQQWFTRSKADIVFYGSARGPGKTFAAMLKAQSRLAYRNNWRGAVFRRRFVEISKTIRTEVEKTSQYIENSQWFQYSWGAEPKVYNPVTNSTLYFSAADRPEDAQKFQGANLHDIYVDEPQNMDPGVLEAMYAILRRVVGDWKPQIHYMANPSGPGHSWLKKRFIDPARKIRHDGNVVYGPDASQYANRDDFRYDEKSGLWFWTNPVGGENVALSQHWRFRERLKSGKPGLVIESILSGTDANPAMDAEEYHQRLEGISSPTLLKAWRDNNWDVRAGEFYPELGAWCYDDVTRTGYSLGVEKRDAVICSIDPGWKTGIVWGAVDEYGEIDVFDAQLLIGHTPDSIARFIKSRHPKLFQDTIFLMDPSADNWSASSGISIADAYRQEGVRVITQEVRNDRVNGWYILRYLGNDGFLRIDPKKASAAVDSLSGLTDHPTTPNDAEKNAGDKFSDDGDHVADALRYLVTYTWWKGESEETEIERKGREIRAELAKLNKHRRVA